MKRLIAAIVLFAATAAHSFESGIPRIGVAKGQFDRIDLCMKEMGIPFRYIPYPELEKKSVYSEYDVILFPCGVESSVKKSLAVTSKGNEVAAVSLKGDYYEINSDKVAALVERYVKRGGIAYFSDYSAIIESKAFSNFTFVDDFPTLGLAGTNSYIVRGGILPYLKYKRLQIAFNSSGWVFPASISNSEILLEGMGDTPKGKMNCIISAITPYGKGEAIYTSYHNGCGDYSRFYIVRTVLSRFYHDVENYIQKRWGGDVSSIAVDMNVRGDVSRDYSLDLSSDENTFYLLFDKGEWGIDIFDSKGLFYSNTRVTSSLKIELDGAKGKKLRVKIYPVNVKPLESYAVTTAYNIKMIPYLWHILILLAMLAIISTLCYSLARKLYRE